MPHDRVDSDRRRGAGLSSPRAAVRAGIGLLARDRAEESVGSALSVRENAFLNPSASGRGLLSSLSPRAEARKSGGARRVGRPSPNAPDLPIEGLSGGNQQKVVVGRWLATGRRLLVAEDPTAGVDVGAKAEIYRLIERALRTKLAVVVVSTDFEEVAPSLPSRARLQSRPDHRRADGRGAHDRVGDHRGLRVRSGLTIGAREAQMATNSIRSDALEPTARRARSTPPGARG